jgi:hypothetical protein
MMTATSQVKMITQNWLIWFKVCNSVHYRTIQINYQPGAKIFQFIILKFIYSSTCFGCFSVHYQELNDCSSSLWLYLRIVATVVTTNTVQLSPRYVGKIRGCHCSHWAPDDGQKTPETCWAVNKRQDNKMNNCCIWLVIHLNSSFDLCPSIISHSIIIWGDSLDITKVFHMQGKSLELWYY